MAYQFGRKLLSSLLIMLQLRVSWVSIVSPRIVNFHLISHLFYFNSYISNKITSRYNAQQHKWQAKEVPGFWFHNSLIWLWIILTFRIQVHGDKQSCKPLVPEFSILVPPGRKLRSLKMLSLPCYIEIFAYKKKKKSLPCYICSVCDLNV